jgi:hypothetical protein
LPEAGQQQHRQNQWVGAGVRPPVTRKVHVLILESMMK